MPTERHKDIEKIPQTKRLIDRQKDRQIRLLINPIMIDLLSRFREIIFHLNFRDSDQSRMKAALGCPTHTLQALLRQTDLVTVLSNLNRVEFVTQTCK